MPFLRLRNTQEYFQVKIPVCGDPLKSRTHAQIAARLRSETYSFMLASRAAFRYPFMCSRWSAAHFRQASVLGLSELHPAHVFDAVHPRKSDERSPRIRIPKTIRQSDLLQRQSKRGLIKEQKEIGHRNQQTKFRPRGGRSSTRGSASHRSNLFE